jgi:hypothetical protein
METTIVHSNIVNPILHSSRWQVSTLSPRLLITLVRWWSGEDEQRRGDASERLRLPPRSASVQLYDVKDCDRRRALSDRNRARYDLSPTVNPSLPRSCNSCSVRYRSLEGDTQEPVYLRTVLANTDGGCSPALQVQYQRQKRSSSTTYHTRRAPFGLSVPRPLFSAQRPLLDRQPRIPDRQLWQLWFSWSSMTIGLPFSLPNLLLESQPFPSLGFWVFPSRQRTALVCLTDPLGPPVNARA